MNLDKLYKLQEELDNHIWSKHGTLDKMSKEELLDNTILALLVEVGELANTTRCFKHWSTKGMMDKEVVLGELADVWHFYLSIGNQSKMKWNNAWKIRKEKVEISQEKTLTYIFNRIYYWSTRKYDKMTYHHLGEWVAILAVKLGFTDEEVEQAYLKKHEENYKRQREGY